MSQSKKVAISLEPLAELPRDDDTEQWGWGEDQWIEKSMVWILKAWWVLQAKKEFMYVRVDFDSLACKHKIS